MRTGLRRFISCTQIPAVYLIPLFLISGFTSRAVDAQISFTPFTEYAAGDRPNSVAVGDFNGDLHLDLATANVNGNDVSILPGDGDGSFGPTQNFAVGEFPVFIATCELNGDARPDLVVADYGFGFNRISVLLNQTEDVNSMAFAHTTYDSAERPIAIACHDLDLDNDVDLAVANQDSDEVLILTNDGAGGFSAQASWDVEVWPWSIQATDLNDDGFPDLAVANNTSDTVSILLQNAAVPGIFLPQMSFPVGSRPSSLAAGDLDGDGDSDLVTANRGSQDITVLLNDGTGLQYMRTDHDVGGGSLSVSLGDVSLDGKLDIVVTSSSDQVVVLPNNTVDPGSFLPPVSLLVASDPRSVTLGDFDNDGKLDIAAANTNPKAISILLNRTADRPKRISCARFLQKTVTLNAGIADGFTLPTETATLGPALAPLCANNKDFDDNTLDNCFGHSFLNLPANLISANLTLNLRADGSAPANDSLHLGLKSGTFAWGSRIGTGGVFSGNVQGLLPFPWNAGTTQSLTLNLGALPNGNGTVTSILNTINTVGDLDIRVTDDTGVDSLTLTARYCESVVINGLDHRPVDSVLTARPFEGDLVVFPIGPEGGVSVGTGSSEGACVQMSCPSAADRGTALELSASGTIFEEPALLGKMTIVNSAPTATFVTDFPNVSSSQPVIVEVCKEGEVISREFLFGNGPIAMIPIDTCIHEVDYLTNNGESKFRILLQELTEVTLPSGEKVDGDSIKTYPQTPGSSGQRLSSFTITSFGAPSFTITGEAIQLFGELQSALGGAILEPSEDRLILSGLDDSGDDGLTVHLDKEESFHMGWLDPDPLGDLPEGARIQLDSTGSIDGGDEQELGSIAMEKTFDGLSLSADFTPIDSPTQLLEVYDDGQLVATIPGNTEVVQIRRTQETSSIWPIGVDKIGGGGATTCYIPTWPDNVIFDLSSFGSSSKESIEGDELRVLAENPNELLDHLDSFTVRTAGLPELTVVEEGKSEIPLPCDDPTRLCLASDRFQIEMTWKDLQGNTGPGQAGSLSDESGTFWFFEPDNVELVVKVLDGREINGHWWLFYGALSDVEYTLTVTDTRTGSIATYFNPAGRFLSVADTRAIPDAVDGVLAVTTRRVVVGSDELPGLMTSREGLSQAPMINRVTAPGTCMVTGQALCLNGGRFQVEVEWEDFQGQSGDGMAVSLTGDSGYFWFFESGNTELVVKVLDGRGVNGHWWFFYGSLSNVGYTIHVTDTSTGEMRSYVNPLSTLGSRGDTSAFAE